MNVDTIQSPLWVMRSVKEKNREMVPLELIKVPYLRRLNVTPSGEWAFSLQRSQLPSSMSISLNREAVQMDTDTGAVFLPRQSLPITMQFGLYEYAFGVNFDRLKPQLRLAYAHLKEIDSTHRDRQSGYVFYGMGIAEFTTGVRALFPEGEFDQMRRLVSDRVLQYAVINEGGMIRGAVRELEEVCEYENAEALAIGVSRDGPLLVTPASRVELMRERALFS